MPEVRILSWREQTPLLMRRGLRNWKRKTVPVGRSLFSWPKPWKPFVCWICAMALTMDVYLLFHSTSLSLCLSIYSSMCPSLLHLSIIIVIYLLYLFSTPPVIFANVYQYIYFIYLSLYFLHCLSVYLSPPTSYLADYRSFYICLSVSKRIYFYLSINLTQSICLLLQLPIRPSIHPSVHLSHSTYPSLLLCYTSICLSIYLSI